ncbi:MAG: hypothetical protein DI549_10755 [Ancylobacter novellus]|uniref:DUF2793 domain-containing protein n=1 Tax=Ancylobacter novellus TaxID=921 RepID=A0A2W5ST30_ANCNO|nr:MAG: hypothetical protein DI549_10755 [Ancylobacter novellus]
MPDRMYNAGTISVAANGTVVTGVGTLWTEVLVPLDTFECEGVRVSVLEVTDDSHLVISPWPGGAKAAADYLVRYDSPLRYESAYMATQVRELVAQLRLLTANVPYYQVVSLGTNAPPGAPAESDSYVVGTAPTGAWAGRANNVAVWGGTAWLFAVPEGGWHAYSAGANALYAFDGAAWLPTNGVASVVGQTGAVSAVQIKSAIASAYFQTLMPAADAPAALTTLGFSSFMAGIRGSADAVAALTGLGFSTFMRGLRGVADAAALLAAMGFSTFMAGIRTAADAAAARTALGAQAALGYTPVNRAGDNAMTGNFVTQGAFIGNNTAPVSGTISGGVFRSDTSGVGSQFAQFYCQNQIGVAIRAAILSVNGAQVGSLVMDSGGNTAISGSLSKASGTFLIDHPLDPYNKDLAHGFVEAPEYQNRYRGLVRLVDGRATVDIDTVAGMSAGTFAALNADAWLAGLQNQEGFARLRPGAITGGVFEIICEDDACTDLVAWEVTARRNDAYVRSGDDPNTDSDGKFICEQEKPE